MAIQMRVLIDDRETDLRAFVVVDSLIGSQAMGGTRMTAHVTLDEVAGLARAMTQKLALIELPIGGAKAGIECGLPPGAERDRRVAEFGRAVSTLLHGGIYLGADQGISHRDRDLFHDAAGFDVTAHVAPSLPCDWSELWRRCHTITGFGICEAIDEAVARLELSSGCGTVAIQGFGTVGRAVAEGLNARGFQVVGVADRLGTVYSSDGLPLAQLLAATDLLGTIDREKLPDGLRLDNRPEAWLDITADVLVLAAGGDAINATNASRVRATVVVEGGNLACSPPAHEELAARGVVVLPDIVVNCGGAAVTGLLLLGAAPVSATLDTLVDWLFTEVAERIRRNISILLERASKDKRPLSMVAHELADERITALRQQQGLGSAAAGAPVAAMAAP